jgi:hypothetical protein
MSGDRPIEPFADPVTGVAFSTQTTARCLAMLSAAAAVIHFDVADMHYQEYWAFGAFMITTAILQAAWVGAALVAPRRWVWAAGAVLNAGIVGVYIVTRVVGDVVGPTPHEVEPVGFGDAFCTVLEALIVVGCVALFFGRQFSISRPRSAGWAVGTTAVVTAALLVVALLDGGSEMTMDSSDSAAAATPAASSTMSGMSMNTAPQSQGVSLRIKSTSPAGDITMPRPMAQMAPGMKMASPPCTATPTLAQQKATVQLVDRSWKAAQRFRSLTAAKAAGYVPITPVGQQVVHYINLKYYEASLAGGPVINPARPQSLVYANTPKGAVLVASMFMAGPGATNQPQPGGCLTQWHIHTNLCFGSFGTVVGLTHDGTKCASGAVHRITPPMLHVWYVPIPGGPTAVDAPDAQVVRAAERVRSPHNPTA